MERDTTNAISVVEPDREPERTIIGAFVSESDCATPTNGYLLPGFIADASAFGYIANP